MGQRESGARLLGNKKPFAVAARSSRSVEGAANGAHLCCLSGTAGFLCQLASERASECTCCAAVLECVGARWQVDCFCGPIGSKKERKSGGKLQIFSAKLQFEGPKSQKRSQMANPTFHIRTLCSSTAGKRTEANIWQMSAVYCPS